MFFAFLAPGGVSRLVVGELIIFSSHIFNHKVVIVCAEHNIQNFVRDVVQGLVVVYRLEALVVRSDHKMGAASQPVPGTFQSGNNGQILSIYGQESFLLFRQ